MADPHCAAASMRACRYSYQLLLAVMAVLGGAILLLPLPAYWITLGNYIGLSSIVALGLVLLTGVAGLTSFGQAAFVGLGAYSTAYLSSNYGLSPWLGLVCGIGITASSAFLIGAISMRLSGHYLPLGTIAWGLSLYYLFGNLEFLGKHDGINGIPGITLLTWDLGDGRRMFCLIWCIVIGATLALRQLLNSRSGRAIRALKGGALMAQAMGVNTAWMKICVFVIAAVLASISGWLYAHMQRAVNPSPFGLNAGIEYLFMAMVGGAGHVWGALLGAGVLTILKDQLQSLLPLLLGSNGNYDMIVFGVLLIVLLQHASDGVWPLLMRNGWPGLFLRRFLPALMPSSAQALAIAPSTAPGMTLALKAKPQAGQVLLQVENARKQFGGLVAVNDMSFCVRAGDIIGLIGPNGAGKSTMFNLLSGVATVTSGAIRFCVGGALTRIDALPSSAIARLGIGRTFQHVHLLTSMSVLENVALGAHLRGQKGILASMAGLDRKEESALLFEARRQLVRVGLGELLYHEAGTLALGQQRLLEIARALCGDPSLLLLDEPAAGLRYLEKQALATLLKKLKAEGMAILIVEHDMDFVMNLTDALVVMEFGSKIAEGLAHEVQNNPAVLAAYLGGID